MKRFLVYALSLLLLTGILFGCGSAPESSPTTVPETTEAGLPGVIFQVPEGVTLELYENFDDQSQTILPKWAESNDGIYSLYFPNLAGIYHYIASGEGYYTVRRNLMISANSSLVIDANPGKRAGTGCEPSEKATVWQLTDQFIENAAPSDPALWPQLADAFTTPWFTNTDRGAHQSTTHGEMVTFLQSLDDADDDLYLYSLGTSPTKGLDMPLVIFTRTDLSSAQTWQDAAVLLQDNGKLTVHFQAQIHGNEPAAGEGALALAKLLDGQMGTLLDTMDIYMVPRINIDGAEVYSRNDKFYNIDMNRDMLLALSKEVQLQHDLLQTFQPHVRFDAHEFDGRCNKFQQTYADVMVSTGFFPHNSDEFFQFCADLADQPFAALEDAGIRSTYYSGIVNGYNSTNGRNYATNLGIVSILIETRGIHMGTGLYARRVASHVITAQSYLNYFAENAETVMALVAQERARIVELGSVYDETDLLTLRSAASPDAAYTTQQTIYQMADGKDYDTERKMPKVYDKAERSRPRPTAYVLPADTAEIEMILQIIDHHGISYYELPAGSTVRLQRYRAEGTEAALDEEANAYFASGAYVFPMNQVTGNILALLMEPDVDDVSENRGTLAQFKLIDTDGAYYDLYRYIHDLTPEGKIP